MPARPASSSTPRPRSPGSAPPRLTPHGSSASGWALAGVSPAVGQDPAVRAGKAFMAYLNGCRGSSILRERRGMAREQAMSPRCRAVAAPAEHSGRAPAGAFARPASAINTAHSGQRCGHHQARHAAVHGDETLRTLTPSCCLECMTNLAKSQAAAGLGARRRAHGGSSCGSRRAPRSRLGSREPGRCALINA